MYADDVELFSPVKAELVRNFYVLYIIFLDLGILFDHKIRFNLRIEHSVNIRSAVGFIKFKKSREFYDRADRIVLEL